MRFSTAMAASLLAIITTVTAAPAAPKSAQGTSKPFKFAITTNKGQGKTLYLTASGTSSDPSAAVTCTIAATKLSCDGKGLTYGAMHTSTAVKLQTSAPKNEGFSVSEAGVITWKNSAGEIVNFSTHGASGAEVFAEICNAKGHPDKEGGLGEFVPGVAKAVWV